MTTDEHITGWSREDMAQRLAQDIPNGAYVNLGIGIPELIARFVPEGREFIYHTENGLLGMGPSPEEGDGGINSIYGETSGWLRLEEMVSHLQTGILLII